MAYLSHSPLIVAQGGTGVVNLTQYYTLIGAGTSAVSLIAPSATAGIPLVSNGNAANPSYTTAVVAGGGTGNTTFTAYSLICAGTTATGVFQNVVGLGSAGQVLTSAGAAALPAWAAIPANVPMVITPVAFGASPYTVLPGDEFLAVDSTGGAITILMEDTPITGRVLTIKDSTGTATGANAMTVTTVSGTDLIDAATTYTINSAYQAIDVTFDSAKYLVF